MHISDWSSDVCSSDLSGKGRGPGKRRGRHPGLRERRTRIGQTSGRAVRAGTADAGCRAVKFLCPSFKRPDHLAERTVKHLSGQHFEQMAFESEIHAKFDKREIGRAHV